MFPGVSTKEVNAAGRAIKAALHRMHIPPIANLPARAAGVDTACPCGEVVKAQRVGGEFVFYCVACGQRWSEPAPRQPVKVVRKVPAKRCQCAKVCRWCRGAR
jgi:hypothetical protein